MRSGLAGNDDIRRSRLVPEPLPELSELYDETPAQEAKTRRVGGGATRSATHVESVQHLPIGTGAPRRGCCPHGAGYAERYVNLTRATARSCCHGEISSVPPLPLTRRDASGASATSKMRAAIRRPACARIPFGSISAK